MPRTEARLLEKLRELEARRKHERLPSRGLLSKFTGGLTEFLRDYRRFNSFYLGSFSIVIYCVITSYVGAIVGALGKWTPIYPAAAACLITIMLRYWVRSAEKKRNSHYRP